MISTAGEGGGAVDFDILGEFPINQKALCHDTLPANGTCSHHAVNARINECWPSVVDGPLAGKFT